jgi:hypothetical protein
MWAVFLNSFGFGAGFSAASLVVEVYEGAYSSILAKSSWLGFVFSWLVDCLRC